MSSDRPIGPLEQQLGQLRSVESLRDLTGRQRKVVAFGFALVGVLLFYAALYNVGMRVLEGDGQPYYHSLQIVVETMTTTGYGSDSPWSSPWMNLLMIWFQVSGVVIGLVTLRILIIPLFERAPVVLDDRLTSKDDHVVVCEYGRGKDVLLDELEASDIPYVLVDSNKQEAIELSNRDYQVIDGDPTDVGTLRRATVEAATLVVTDAEERNASVALTARQANDDVRLLCLTESPERREALELVGADWVVCPPALIGRRLAEKATTVDPGVGDALGEGTVVRELVVRRTSPVEGATIGETVAGESSGLTVVAAWVEGELHLPPSPDLRLTPNTVLVVVGPSDAFDEVQEAITGVRTPQRHTSVVVAGLGEAGRTAVESLPSDVSVTTVDVRDDPDVDVVGDVTESETLAEAGVVDASTLLVTVDDDDTALLAAALARSMTDDLELLVRVIDAESVPKAFAAGADYALSEQRTTARTLATAVHDDAALHPVGQVRFIRVDGGRFDAATLGEARERDDRRSMLVGVQRDGRLRTDATTTIGEGDRVVVAGVDEDLRPYE